MLRTKDHVYLATSELGKNVLYVLSLSQQTKPMTFKIVPVNLRDDDDLKEAGYTCRYLAQLPLTTPNDPASTVPVASHEAVHSPRRTTTDVHIIGILFYICSIKDMVYVVVVILSLYYVFVSHWANS